MATALAAAQQRYPMSLNVPPEFERAIRERVESGAYASADDVFAACLKALAEWEDVQRAKYETLRAEIQVGIDQADRGQLVDGPEALRRIRERFSARLER
jgi:antitoxin ParD1/3/4